MAGDVVATYTLNDADFMRGLSRVEKAASNSAKRVSSADGGAGIFNASTASTARFVGRLAGVASVAVGVRAAWRGLADAANTYAEAAGTAAGQTAQWNKLATESATAWGRLVDATKSYWAENFKGAAKFFGSYAPEMIYRGLYGKEALDADKARIESVSRARQQAVARSVQEESALRHRVLTGDTVGAETIRINREKQKRLEELDKGMPQNSFLKGQLADQIREDAKQAIKAAEDQAKAHERGYEFKRRESEIDAMRVSADSSKNTEAKRRVDMLATELDYDRQIAAVEEDKLLTEKQRAAIIKGINESRDAALGAVQGKKYNQSQDRVSSLRPGFGGIPGLRYNALGVGNPNANTPAVQTATNTKKIVMLLQRAVNQLDKFQVAYG